MYCDVCQGCKKIKVATYPMLNAVDALADGFEVPTVTENFREFDCPQCVPTVPYRRVRAMKIVTSYPVQEYGKFQMPIERSLAARFGEYLMREGLIRFSTTGSKDFGTAEDKISITAHLGVVSREDVKRSGAVEEVATTPRPSLPERVRKRANVSERAVPWQPRNGGFPGVNGEPELTDEFDEPKDALGARFSGLEL